MGGTWSEIALAGHNCHVYEPAEPSSHPYVAVYLHDLDLDLLHDRPAFCEQFDRYGLRVVCPVTGPSWWTDRVCQAFDPQRTAARYVLDEVMPEIANRWGAQPPRIALLGIGAGGQGALRLAFKYPDTFPVVAAISPTVDYYLHWEANDTLQQMYSDPEAARQDSAILHIHPLYWPRNTWFCCAPRDFWHSGADRLRMKLSALGIPHESELERDTDGGGFAYYNSMAPSAMGFIYERLERERLRAI